MSALVLDTDIVSFFAKGDTRASLYAPVLVGSPLCICFQTVAELHLWALVRQWSPTRRQSVDALLLRYIVLPYDARMSQHWAEVTAHRKRIGRPIDCGDAWIAASALRHRATLVTHNAKDYATIPGLKMITR